MALSCAQSVRVTVGLIRGSEPLPFPLGPLPPNTHAHTHTHARARTRTHKHTAGDTWDRQGLRPFARRTTVLCMRMSLALNSEYSLTNASRVTFGFGLTAGGDEQLRLGVREQPALSSARRYRRAKPRRMQCCAHSGSRLSVSSVWH
jgi:hypothetical protein